MEWYVFAIFSALLSGIVPIIDKRILSRINVIDFSTMYSTLNFILSLSLLFWIDFTINLRIAFLIFIAAGFGSLAFYTINKALKKYDVSVVSPLRSFNPVILLVLASLFLGERLTGLNILGILLIVFGAYIIEARHFLHKPLHPIRSLLRSRVIVLVLYSSLFYAFSSMLDKVILKQYDVLAYLIMVHLFIAVNFSVINLIEHGKTIRWNKRMKSVFWLILISSVITLGYRGLLAQSIALAPMVALVIPIKHMDSLVATVLGGELFHEDHLVKKFIAAAVMFAGVLLIVL